MVVRCSDPRHAVVEFTEIGSSAVVPTSFITQTSGVVPKPILRVRKADFLCEALYLHHALSNFRRYTSDAIHT